MGSRGEMQAVIDRQKEQLQKYQTKLRDVVAAYKGLQSEKAALEASVNALSASSPAPTESSRARTKAKAAEAKAAEAKAATKQTAASESDQTEDTATEDEGNEEERAQQEEEKEEEISKLQDQLRTLTASLATLTQEKSKMQASFQADKKKIRQEQEERATMLEEEKEQQHKQIQDLQEQMQEWKQRLRSQQHDREKDQDDHAVMLRELQKLLARERANREQIENQLDDARQALVNKETSPDVIKEYDRKFSQLQGDLKAHQAKIRSMEEKAKEPPPMVLQMQKEMEQIKAEHRMALQQEQRRATEAERQVSAASRDSEERISTLEAKVAELSGVVGTYEKQRRQDHAALAKMRERITQLDMENTALAKATHNVPGSDTEDFEDGQDVESIVEKITRLKAALKLANEKAEKPVNIEDLLDGGSVDLHHACREEINQIKEEFERYKLRAQSVLKNKATTKAETTSPEMDSLKQQSWDLKERLRYLRQDYEEQESSHKQKEETLRRTITGLQEKHRQELINKDAECKLRITELEGEVRKHRNRTISLLAEKDREIEVLRENSPEKFESTYINQYRHGGGLLVGVGDDPGAAASSEQDLVMAELFTRTSLTGNAVGETALLHFAQEQARKDVEIETHRRQKHSLEMALRDLQHSCMMKEERYSSQIEDLNEQIRKLERNKSRESANLEYLKNVVYHYMVCQDSLGKQQMLRAISTILQFSPKESDKVMAIISGSWWGAGAKPT